MSIAYLDPPAVRAHLAAIEALTRLPPVSPMQVYEVAWHTEQVRAGREAARQGRAATLALSCPRC